MQKIFNVFLLAISTTLSLHGADHKTKSTHANRKASIKKVDDLNVNNSLKSTPWVTVTVTDAPGLTTAIQNAATNPVASTIIYINGTIIGNFVIPATVNQVKLVGIGVSPTISANGTGNPLTILLGGIVSIDSLKIAGSGAPETYGITSYGSLRIFQSVIDGNANGIYNAGELFVKESSISSNTFYGIETQEGSVIKITDSSISNNSSSGIYLSSTAMLIENSSINGNGDRGFFIYYGSTLVINHCQINGNTGYGINNSFNSSTTVIDSTIENNSTGGFFNDGCTCSIKDSTIANHSSYGIYNYNYSLLDIKNCTFTNNQQSAIFNTNSATLFVDKSTFRDNSSAESFGGAIYNDTSGVATVSNCLFTSNTAVSGGAIYNKNLFTLLDSKIKKNESTQDGAGIYNDSTGSFVARNVHVRDNVTIAGEGGGMYNLGTATIINGHIKYNSSSRGGGFANITPAFMGFATSSGATLSITNSLVKHNVATSSGGGGIYNTGTLTTENSDISENIPDQIAP